MSGCWKQAKLILNSILLALRITNFQKKFETVCSGRCARFEPRDICQSPHQANGKERQEMKRYVNWGKKGQFSRYRSKNEKINKWHQPNTLRSWSGMSGNIFKNLESWQRMSAKSVTLNYWPSIWKWWADGRLSLKKPVAKSHLKVFEKMSVSNIESLQFLRLISKSGISGGWAPFWETSVDGCMAVSWPNCCQKTKNISKGRTFQFVVRKDTVFSCGKHRNRY